MLKPLAIVSSSLLLVSGLKYLDTHEAKKYQEFDPTVSDVNPLEMCIKNHYLHPLAMRDRIELRIVINGEEQIIPEDIGVTEDCIAPIHTTNNTGIIRVRYPIEYAFTLGDFFEIWGKPFSATILLDQAVDAHHEIVLTVDGQKREEYENLVLKHDQIIVIEYKTSDVTSSVELL